MQNAKRFDVKTRFHAVMDDLFTAWAYAHPAKFCTSLFYDDFTITASSSTAFAAISRQQAVLGQKTQLAILK